MRRLLLVPTGVLLAFLAGLLVLAGGLAWEAAAVDAATGGALIATLATLGGHGGEAAVRQGLLLLWTAAVAACFLPVLLAALVGEAMRSRGWLWYAAAAGTLSAAMPTLLRAALALPPSGGGAESRATLLLFLAGVLAGSVYWLVAGRSAGGERV